MNMRGFFLVSPMPKKKALGVFSRRALSLFRDFSRTFSADVVLIGVVLAHACEVAGGGLSARKLVRHRRLLRDRFALGLASLFFALGLGAAGAEYLCSVPPLLLLWRALTSSSDMETRLS